jgi:hypothetical protein
VGLFKFFYVPEGYRSEFDIFGKVILKAEIEKAVKSG